MADIGGLAQECIGRGAKGILLKFPDEQQDSAPLCGVVDIPLTSGRIGSGGRLALPKEQGRTKELSLNNLRILLA